MWLRFYDGYDYVYIDNRRRDTRSSILGAGLAGALPGCDAATLWVGDGGSEMKLMLRCWVLALAAGVGSRAV